MRFVRARPAVMYSAGMPVFRAFILAVLSSAVVGCGPSAADSADGDAHRGRELLRQYGCNACHRIPGVADAVGTVGPPLDDIGARIYLAGTLPNSAQNMARWIRAPESFKPGTAMPNLNVTEQHARDMVAFLERLR